MCLFLLKAQGKLCDKSSLYFFYVIKINCYNFRFHCTWKCYDRINFCLEIGDFEMLRQQKPIPKNMYFFDMLQQVNCCMFQQKPI